MDTNEVVNTTVQAILDQIKREGSTEASIHTFLHCARCIQEMPPGNSPKKWSRSQVGITPEGILVWCGRHNQTIVLLTPELLQRFMEVGPQCGRCN